MDFLVLTLIGLVVGVLGAMLGLGGSIVLIPALNEVFGTRQHLHQASAMILNFFVVSSATWGHRQAGAVCPRIVKITIPSAVASVIVGVQLSELPIFQGEQQRYLTGALGLFLLVSAGIHAGKLLSAQRPAPNGTFEPDKMSSLRVAFLVGVPTGLVSGLLGVGGGLIAVPAQHLLLGIPLRQAIGNSAATICGLSLIGAALKNYHWWAAHDHGSFAPLVIAAIVVPTAVLGGLIGSRLTHTLPTRWVGGVLVLVLIIAGLRQISHLAI